MDDQAIPTMPMATNNIFGSVMKLTQIKPNPPISKQSACVIFLPNIFTMVGIRKETVEIEGDWSGGTHNVCQKGWVKHTDIEPYDQTKVRYYVNGKPFMNGVAIT